MPLKRKIEHSQNFIRQPETVRNLLILSNIQPNDLVIEIGPGRGIITRELLKQAGQVIAIELDARFSEELFALERADHLQLIIGDFLEWELPNTPYKVFSNIPFNYTSDIINKLASSENKASDIYLVMQLSAAWRFVGPPYQKNSLMSILLSLEFAINILTEIDRESFNPVPSVKIVFVHFRRRSEPLVSKADVQLFRDFVVYGYTQWAPTALEAFGKVFTKRQRSIIARSQKLKHLKPSELSIEQWIELFTTFSQVVSDEKKLLVEGQEKRLIEQQKNVQKSYRTREN